MVFLSLTLLICMIASEIPFSLDFLVMDPGYNRENRSLIESTLQDFAKEHKCPFDVFFNVKLAKIDSSKTSSDMELDIVAQLRDRFYIFETKTGILGIDKWVARAKMFSVDQKSRFITCCADETIPAYLFEPYQFVPLSALKKAMVQMLGSDLTDG